MTTAEQVASNLTEIRRKITEACQRCGRNAEEITILGASKSQPMERLIWAWEAGLRVFGENRVQEAQSKMPLLPAATEWHLIGPLQSNKAKKAVPLFRTIHSVDRPKIAWALDREATRLGRSLQAFVEVNLAAEATKHGFLPTDLPARLEPLTALETLQIVGFMAIPPFEPDPEGARDWFRQLRRLRDELCARPEWGKCPGLLSMGMSHDYPIAVEEGATHVRIGTSLFGPRGP
jgi:pyridoxal phosphate enzyme (YggS family)